MHLNLESHFYTEPDIFLQERAGLLSQSWQLLGPASAVASPGQYISEDIAGIKVIVIRGQDNILRGFRNVCRHRGAQLIPLGSGSTKTIVCPYHCWSYHDTGLLKHAPWFGEDPEFDPAKWSLSSIQVATWRGLLFVAIDPVESLEQQLGDTIAELSDIELEDFHNTDCEKLIFDANWKIYTDNFVEGYHIPGIHPEFFAAIDFEQFTTTAHENLVRMTAPAKEDLFYKGRWYWMWPNWTLSLFDGGINTSRINPLSHDRTELIYHFYFDDTSEAGSSKRADIVQRNLAVVRQDFEICLATHRNYAAGGYQPGPLSPRHERGVAWFQQAYRNALSPLGRGASK